MTHLPLPADTISTFLFSAVESKIMVSANTHTDTHTRWCFILQKAARNKSTVANGKTRHKENEGRGQRFIMICQWFSAQCLDSRGVLLHVCVLLWLHSVVLPSSNQ